MGPIALVALALASFAFSAPARALEPKKPSQLVTLTPSGTCAGGEGFRYGNRVHPDGTFTPFTIPPKQVLVLTRWSFIFSGGAAVASAAAVLETEGASAAHVRRYFPFDADGRGGGESELSVVIGEGQTLCGYALSSDPAVGPFDGFLQGYLTKAK